MIMISTIPVSVVCSAMRNASRSDRSARCATVPRRAAKNGHRQLTLLSDSFSYNYKQQVQIKDFLKEASRDLTGRLQDMFTIRSLELAQGYIGLATSE